MLRMRQSVTKPSARRTRRGNMSKKESKASGEERAEQSTEAGIRRSGL